MVVLKNSYSASNVDDSISVGGIAGEVIYGNSTKKAILQAIS
jgi:hypothetical protein